MPKDQAATQLASLITKLQAERQEHLDAITQIDETFERFGISPAPTPAKRRGRPRKAGHAAMFPPVAPTRASRKAVKKTRRGKRGTRRTFETSGLDSILGFIKQAGAKGVTTSEIVEHWKSEGRAGEGYTTLGQLVRENKVKRKNIKGERGSRYKVA